jgi:hypothetical protein
LEETEHADAAGVAEDAGGFEKFCQAFSLSRHHDILIGIYEHRHSRTRCSRI